MRRGGRQGSYWIQEMGSPMQSRSMKASACLTPSEGWMSEVEMSQNICSFCYGRLATISRQQQSEKLSASSRRRRVTWLSIQRKKKRTPLRKQKSSDYQTVTLFGFVWLVYIYMAFAVANGLLQLGPERFRAPELLFSPEMIGLEASGAHQVVVDSINKADLDLRKNLFSNIVLSGGSTLCKGILLKHSDWNLAEILLGYGDRMLNEVKKLALKDVKVCKLPFLCSPR